MFGQVDFHWRQEAILDNAKDIAQEGDGEAAENEEDEEEEEDPASAAVAAALPMLPLTKKTIGFIAQEVEEVFPELVHAWDTGDQRGVIKGIAYNGFAPILVEAVKEQHLTMAQQAQELSDLRARVAQHEKEIISLRHQMLLLARLTLIKNKTALKDRQQPNTSKKERTRRGGIESESDLISTPTAATPT